jgi:hypothetical protein
MSLFIRPRCIVAIESIFYEDMFKHHFAVPEKPQWLCLRDSIIEAGSVSRFKLLVVDSSSVLCRGPRCAGISILGSYGSPLLVSLHGHKSSLKSRHVGLGDCNHGDSGI